MKTLGLTGGIGMGKSTVAELLRERGVRVVDTDQLAREVVQPGQPALMEIRAGFGEGVITAAGALDRVALAERVFVDLPARQRLEAILHPRIRERWKAQLAGWRAVNEPLAVVVIPLLFEIEAQGEFDATVCVACSASTQHRRLLGRGWTEAQISQRLQAQLSVEKKMALARYVLWNDGDMTTLAAQLDRVLARLP